MTSSDDNWSWLKAEGLRWQELTPMYRHFIGDMVGEFGKVMVDRAIRLATPSDTQWDGWAPVLQNAWRLLLNNEVPLAEDTSLLGLDFERMALAVYEDADVTRDGSRVVVERSGHRVVFDEETHLLDTEYGLLDPVSVDDLVGTVQAVIEGWYLPDTGEKLETTVEEFRKNLTAEDRDSATIIHVPDGWVWVEEIMRILPEETAFAVEDFIVIRGSEESVRSLLQESGWRVQSHGPRHLILK